MSLAIGQTVGEWTILSQVDDAVRGRKYFNCQCSCGVKKVVKGWHIESGSSRSCGHTKARRHQQVMQEVFTLEQRRAAARVSA